MLNLFRLPFWRQKLESDPGLPEKDLSIGIARNLLQSADKGSDDQNSAAMKTIEEELNSLRHLLGQSPKEDRYELMKAALRKIDQGLMP